MSFAQKFEAGFRWLLPNPFTIAILLTVLTFGLAFFFTTPASGAEGWARIAELATFWEQGVWDKGLLVFMVQMMLILVLGHALALAPPLRVFIQRITQSFTTPARAAFLIAFFSLAVALFNWGLGLVFGAIMVKAAGDHFSERAIPFNYGLLGAAGYSGLMIWHGGLSGSAPLKVVESGHLSSLYPKAANMLPGHIPLSDTLFSSMNLTASGLLLLGIPGLLYLMAKQSTSRIAPTVPIKKSEVPSVKGIGAEKLDHSRWLAAVIGLCMLLFCTWRMYTRYRTGISPLDLNTINLALFGLCITAHRSFYTFLRAIEQAIGGAAGILIQFPLYFGIMGIMRSSGLASDLSNFFSTIATAQSLPVFSFLSAGLINLFVPSGGGQWSIQGPILIEACLQTGAPLPKTIMAMAYGDEITNMLQPFWALPLLGITGLRARDVIPYSFVLFLAGSSVYLLVLYLF